MKILLVGLGSVGQRHARNLRALLGKDLTLLAHRVRGRNLVINPDLSVSPTENIETTYGITTFSDFGKALAEKPDAVFITNPNSLHMDVALAAAKAKCHLFIEKPLSHDFKHVPELISLVKKNKLTCLVGYQLRFHPGFKKMQELLKTEAVGRPLAANLEFGEYLPSWHKYEDYHGYHAARKDQGGGVILSHIHDLDCMYALFGMPRSVFAVGGKLSRLDIDVEDVASILMACGTEKKPIPVHLHQDYLQKPPVRKYKVLTENGTILWDYYANKVFVTDRDKPEPEVFSFDNFDRNQLFMDETKHFLACLKGSESPVVGAADGASSLTIALAAKKSLESGRLVEVR